MNRLDTEPIDDPADVTAARPVEGMAEADSTAAQPGGRGSDDARKPPSSHWLQFVLIAGAVVVLDQITKRYVDANLALGQSWPSDSWPFRFMHVKNTGAAFSMLQNQTLFLTLMSVFGLGAILLYFRFRPSDHPLLRIALGLQLGGAIGNLIDRAAYGEVTDFLKIPNWPVFNIADSAISVGVVTVVVFLLFMSEKQQPRRAAPPS